MNGRYSVACPSFLKFTCLLLLINIIIVLFSVVFVNIDNTYKGRHTSHFSQDQSNTYHHPKTQSSISNDDFLLSSSNVESMDSSKSTLAISHVDNVVEDLILSGKFKEDFLENKYNMCDNPYLHLCSKSPIDIQELIERENIRSLREVVDRLKDKSVFGKACRKFNSKSYNEKIIEFLSNKKTLETLSLLNTTFFQLEEYITTREKSSNNKKSNFTSKSFELLGNLSKIGVREPFHINRKITDDLFFEESPRNPRNIDHLGQFFILLRSNVSEIFENKTTNLFSMKSSFEAAKNIFNHLIGNNFLIAKENYLFIDTMLHNHDIGSDVNVYLVSTEKGKSKPQKYKGYNGYTDEQIYKLYQISLDDYLDESLLKEFGKDGLFYVDPNILINISKTFLEISKGAVLFTKYKHYVLLATIKSLLSQMRILSPYVSERDLCSNQMLHFFSREICHLFKESHKELNNFDSNEKSKRYVSKLYEDFKNQMIQNNYFQLNQKELEKLRDYLSTVELSTNQCLFHKEKETTTIGLKDDSLQLKKLLQFPSHSNHSNSINFIDLNYQILSNTQFKTRIYPFFDDFGRDSIEKHILWNSLTYTSEDIRVVAIIPGVLHYTFNALNMDGCERRGIIDPIIYHEFSHLIYYFFDSSLYISNNKIYHMLIEKIRKIFKNEKDSENFADVLGFHFAYSNYAKNNQTTKNKRSIKDKKCYFTTHFKLFCQPKKYFVTLNVDDHSNNEKRALNSILLNEEDYRNTFNCDKK